MALITETAAKFTTAGAKEGMEVKFRIMEKDFSGVRDVAADPDNPTVGERVFAEAVYPVTRSDDRQQNARRSEFVHLSDDNMSEFVPGDAAALRALLRKVADSLQPVDL